MKALDYSVEEAADMLAVLGFVNAEKRQQIKADQTEQSVDACPVTTDKEVA